MKNPIITTQNLIKKFGSFYALDHVSLTLEKGHIYGFIGENGAGKTTLLRIFAGLSYETAGEWTIFGKSTLREKEQIRRNIGSTIEEPVLYPNLTAIENMELQRKLLGNPDKGNCRELLNLVGLDNAGRKKAKQFSMGMKQRLGLALALINKPQLLLLDEPVNGLDPKGIADLRNLLKKLNQEYGVTILISSHILNELYLLATDYIIIKDGRIMDAISHEELEMRCRKYISINMENVPQGLTILERGLETTDYKVMEDGTVRLYSHVSQLEKVARLLHENEVLVTGLSISEQTLEEFYFEAAGGEEHA